jgi:capsular polysaccharide transport system permease protein
MGKTEVLDHKKVPKDTGERKERKEPLRVLEGSAGKDDARSGETASADKKQAERRSSDIASIDARSPDTTRPQTRPTPAGTPEAPHADPKRKQPDAAPRRTNKARPARRSFLRRRAGLISSFLALVLLPALACTAYLVFIAADEYHSRTSFSVRSIEAAASSDILGMFTQASSGNTTSDSYILIDFIRSERMLRAIEAKFDFEAIYAVRGLDYVYGLRPGLPLEERLRYWRRMMDVTYDHTSGIMELTVYAFNPAQSREIAQFVLDESETLINTLSRNARKTVLEEAQREIVTAEDRLKTARSAVREYRNTTQEIDPVEGARLTGQLISSLELQLAQLNTSLSTARAEMSEDSPRIRVLKSQIDSLRQQIDLERARIGQGTVRTNDDSTDMPVAGRLQQFEALETERDFAERAYAAALSSMESARQDANNRQRYLATFIEPTLSERAQYPARLLTAFLATLAFLFGWTVIVMAYYNIKDRN